MTYRSRAAIRPDWQNELSTPWGGPSGAQLGGFQGGGQPGPAPALVASRLRASFTPPEPVGLFVLAVQYIRSAVRVLSSDEEAAATATAAEEAEQKRLFSASHALRHMPITSGKHATGEDESAFAPHGESSLATSRWRVIRHHQQNGNWGFF